FAPGFRALARGGGGFSPFFAALSLSSPPLVSIVPPPPPPPSPFLPPFPSLAFAAFAGAPFFAASSSFLFSFSLSSFPPSFSFSPPPSLSHFLTQIVFPFREDQKGIHLSSPSLLSGSLLLNAKPSLHPSDTVSYSLEAINTHTYNLARPNMLLHGVAI
ncbi:type I restriction-modification system subunit M, partial [Streptococcus pyogenes]